MSVNEVTSYGGIAVGDYVRYSKESGFDAGRHQYGKVVKIKVRKWDRKDVERLNLGELTVGDNEEPLYVLTNGELVGSRDGVRWISEEDVRAIGRQETEQRKQMELEHARSRH